MKYLAVDFGEKNIGLAISDSEGKIALPLKILKNNKDIWNNMESVILEQKVDAVVFGKSLNLDGKPNRVNSLIEKFAKNFEKKFCNVIKNISQNIFFENEIFSSREAKWGVEKSPRRVDVKNKKGSRKSKKENLVDHKAAAMILKSFLEKNNSEK